MLSNSDCWGLDGNDTWRQVFGKLETTFLGKDDKEHNLGPLRRRSPMQFLCRLNNRLAVALNTDGNRSSVEVFPEYCIDTRVAMDRNTINVL